jgi:hypothetical protein
MFSREKELFSQPNKVFSCEEELFPREERRLVSPWENTVRGGKSLLPEVKDSGIPPENNHSWAKSFFGLRERPRDS